MADVREQLTRELADRYVVERQVGRGGMATVYLARDLRHDRAVAIKALDPEVAGALGSKRFLREIQFIARLNHPHILPLLDSGAITYEGTLSVPYYVMPFVAGETLRARLAREVQLPVDEALRITLEVCDALAHAHAQNVVHRDIKPENILLQAGHAIVADFGIARAIDRAAEDARSSEGLAIGTPAYMSPEQVTASRLVDGRSDLYSLGCVLFEMLAGEPPFTGPTAQAVSARHLYETLPSLQVVRPGVSPAIRAVVERVLAKVPADRYATAGDLAQALTTAAQARGETADERRRWWKGLAFTFGVAASVWWILAQFTGGPKLDPTLFVVLPFAHRSEAAPEPISGENCAQLVSDALAHWTDLGVVSSLTVRGELSLITDPFTLQSAFALARRVGAGRLIWGEVSQLTDSVRVLATLYDVGKGKELRSQVVRLSPRAADLGPVAARFAELTYALVLPGLHTPADVSDALGTKSLAAWKAYVVGDSALGNWNLELARQRFREATALDPEYPEANLQLAQVGEWTDEPSAEWRTFVARAIAGREKLTKAEQLTAAGLAELADGEYAAACQRFHALTGRDSLDFRGWFGLGECNAKDALVVPDSASPSRWRFRGSYHTAVRAYERALRMVPLSHRAFGGAAISRLEKRLFVESTQFRVGFARTPDSASYAAYPALDHDTLAFVPYRMAEVLTAQHMPQSHLAAVARGLSTLLDITSTWVQHFPRSLPALQSNALALELSGEIGRAGRDERSALTTVRTARGLSSHAEQLELGAWEVRLLLKLSQVASAKALADSLLASSRKPDPRGARALAGVAALVGQIHHAAELLAASTAGDTLYSPEGKPLAAPLPVRENGLRLLVYAAFGTPAESVHVLAPRIDTLIRTHVERARRVEVRNAVLERPALLAFPLLPAPPCGWRLCRLEQALARGDTATARHVAAALDSLRAMGPPGAWAVDAAFLQARLRLAAGDTADAVNQLETALQQIPTAGTNLVSEVPQVAALVRAMALRAEIGALQGQRASARYWAGQVGIIWASADRELQPMVTRLQHVASGSGVPPPS